MSNNESVEIKAFYDSKHEEKGLCLPDEKLDGVLFSEFNIKVLANGYPSISIETLRKVEMARVKSTGHVVDGLLEFLCKKGIVKKLECIFELSKDDYDELIANNASKDISGLHKVEDD